MKSINKLAGFGYEKLNQYFIYDSNFTGDNNNLEMDEILKVTVYCDFDFQSFPFDDQECDFSLYDPVNDASWVVFDEIHYMCYKNKHCFNEDEDRRWMNLPDQHSIPYQIRMRGMPTLNWTMTNSSYSNDPYSYSTVRFSFQRNSFELLIGSFYIPTGLFALLSTGSFIINPETVSAYTTYNNIIFMSTI